MNRRQVDRWIEEWQKRLRLQDWTVRWKTRKANEMTSSPPACAEISYFRKGKYAELYVVDPDHLADSGLFPDKDMDLELSIVHELVHLHLVGWWHETKDDEHVAEEQAVTAISEALVAAKRGE